MIWCDLDNTLIWTWQPLITSPLLSAMYGLPIETKPPVGKGRRRLTRIAIPGVGVGYVCCRKSAGRFLQELRRLNRVKLLTSATRKYAVAMDKAFRLGFGCDDIVARDALKPTTHALDPRAVLIDDKPQYGGDHCHHANRARKLHFLSASPEMVIEVPHFTGEVDDPFERNWRQYVREVRRRIETQDR